MPRPLIAPPELRRSLVWRRPPGTRDLVGHSCAGTQRRHCAPLGCSLQNLPGHDVAGSVHHWLREMGRPGRRPRRRRRSPPALRARAGPRPRGCGPALACTGRLRTRRARPSCFTAPGATGVGRPVPRVGQRARVLQPSDSLRRRQMRLFGRGGQQERPRQLGSAGPLKRGPLAVPRAACSTRPHIRPGARGDACSCRPGARAAPPDGRSASNFLGRLLDRAAPHSGGVPALAGGTPCSVLGRQWERAQSSLRSARCARSSVGLAAVL